MAFYFCLDIFLVEDVGHGSDPLERRGVGWSGMDVAVDRHAVAVQGVAQYSAVYAVLKVDWLVMDG